MSLAVSLFESTVSAADTHTHTHIYIYMCVRVRVCVCVLNRYEGHTTGDHTIITQ